MPYGQVFPFILLIAGILLIIAEVLIPGFGLPGISGIILLAIAISSFVDSLLLIIVYLFIAGLVSLGLGFLIAYFLRETGRLNKIVLDNKLDKKSGYVSNKDREEYLNLEGIALTDLRPSGFINIEGERLDAITSGEYIKKGEKVVVSKADGFKIIVRRV